MSARLDTTSFAQDGIVRLPGALLNSAELRDFIIDLIWSGESLLRGRRPPRRGDLDLRDAADELERTVLELHEKGPVTRYFQALASHPMKLLSGARLRGAKVLEELLREALGPESVIAFPQLSDALTIFFKVDDEASALHQSLPIHQDYPYLMQSSAQVVVWVPLTRAHPDVGSIDYWPGSHRAGVVRQHVIGDYYEVAPEAVSDFERLSGAGPARLSWELGDLVLFDSKLFHRTVPNSSSERARIIQVFRASDLSAGDGLEYAWRSAGYVDRNAEHPKTVRFEDNYAGLWDAVEKLQ